MISEQLFKYVNEGSEYMLHVQQETEQAAKKVHNAIMLDIQLNAPVLFVPECYDRVEDNQVLVVDLGSVRVDSQLIEFNPEQNYKLLNNPAMLFDAYNFLQKDMQVISFTQLPDYRRYATADHTFKLIKDVSLKLNFYNNIEQRHPFLPNYEISVALESMTITASDHIFLILMKLKDTLLKKLLPPQASPSAGASEP